MLGFDLRRGLLSAGLTLVLAVPASFALASTAHAVDVPPVARGAKAPTPFQVLERGDTGRRVLRVQRWLDSRRTGFYGKRTARHVRMFQDHRGLNTTGKVNGHTWRALETRWTRMNSRYARIIAEAKRHYGDPYVYGAAGPHAFDCSGFTMYVYRQAAGVGLPHQSGSQYRQATKISRAEARPGDLVFFHSGSSVYHAAIYAGKNRVIHSPGSGRVVTRDRIWSSSVWFGRVINR